MAISNGCNPNPTPMKFSATGFSENYGWCEIIGPQGFFKGDDFLLGLLMLGPQRHYKDHYHPAPELYWPLTGPTEWKQGAGGFETKPGGCRDLPCAQCSSRNQNSGASVIDGMVLDQRYPYPRQTG